MTYYKTVFFPTFLERSDLVCEVSFEVPYLDWCILENSKAWESFQKLFDSLKTQHMQNTNQASQD